MSAEAAPRHLPLRLAWLASPQRRPAALHVDMGRADPEAWAALLAEPALHALCAALPCVLATDEGADKPDGVSVAGLVFASEAKLLHAPLVFPAQPPSGCWISGDWYQQAPAKAAAAQAASRVRALQLLQLVSADADTHDIEAVLRQDATLSYHLLRVVNSVAMGLQREITSFAQAILLLGRQQLRRWLQLLLFAARDDDPRSAMLSAHVTLRARSMELLAEACGLDRATQELAFMVGMFSMLGTLFGQPLPQVLASLSLPDALRRALLDGEGTLGQLLGTVTAAEGMWGAEPLGAPHADALVMQLDALGTAAASFNRLRLQAALWTVQMSHDPGQGAA